MSLSGYSSGGGGGTGSGDRDKSLPVNSLLNAFVPDDLVTFSMVPMIPQPQVNYSLPPSNPVGPPTSVDDVTSEEIDLGIDDDIEICADSPSISGRPETFGSFEAVEEGINESDELNGEPQIFAPVEQLPTASSTDDTTSSLASTTEIVTDPPPQHPSQVFSSEYSLEPESHSNAEVPTTQSLNRPLLQNEGGIMEGSRDISTFTELTVTATVTSDHVHTQHLNPLVDSHPSALQEVTGAGFGSSSPHPPFDTSTSSFVNPIWPLGQLGQALPAPNPSTNSNMFRMGRQKPVYAKYPGLETPHGTTENHQQPMITPTGPPMSSDEAYAGRNLFQPPPPPPAPASTPQTNFQPPSAAPPAQSPEPWQMLYTTVAYHWFYRKDGELWKPFSHLDSKNLEEGLAQGSKNLVPVDGGRYDVDLDKRIRQPVYWEDTEVTHVQRCSWFYKGPMDSQFIPYSESFSARLEEEYAISCRTNTWQRRLEFSGGEAVVLQGPHSFVHFCQQASADEWGSVPESQLRPRVVKRGAEGLQIPPGEPTEVEYLVFLVHGIGSFCDFKFRSVVETVDDFRQISNQLLQSHFKDVTGRVEFLPVQWHNALHGEGGIDDKLKPLTLKSIPKLRHFTNDTLLDILFYTSPVYCQTIIDTVGNEMNRLYSLFLDRNPSFNCLSVAVAGHSLGSLILFDLLNNQPELVLAPNPTKDADGLADSAMQSSQTELTGQANRLVSYRVGPAGTGQPSIVYPVLDFQPTAFFAMGSPIAMFVAVRGLDSLGLDFRFPTCPAFFNIFHPYDPVAYRIESLIDPTLDLRPVLIPHHKGRKRFHLELKETMTRVGTDLKNRILDSLRVTYRAVTHLAGISDVEQEVDDAIASALNGEPCGGIEELSEDAERKMRVGCLNGGRRIDFVLQEAPHQIINEYLFALSSHVCYWESDDTVLLVLNEILNEGRSTPSTPDPCSPTQASTTEAFQFPMQHGPTSNSPPQVQQETPYQPTISTPDVMATAVMFQSTSMQTQASHVPPLPNPGSYYTTGKRPVIDPTFVRQPIGMDPTAPITTSGSQLPPPPKSGFLRKN